jgi:NAD(P)-dependent dehydrogenase (short-subunit alcohol dehydrogenase family)
MNQMKRLAGKSAIVSGSYSGIGKAIATRLAAEGALVVLANRNTEAGEKAAGQIRDLGGDAISLPLDLADESSISALMTQTRKLRGSLSILCNCASITGGTVMQSDQDVAGMPPATWQAVFNVNTTGTMLMIKHALPMLMEAGDSAIINIGSGASLVGDVFRPAYAASKAAIDSLTRSVATQYGKKGVRCNTVAPGMILSENAVKFHTDASLAMIRRHALTRELGQPDDIAAMVALLASDEGRFITGQTIQIDGGYTVHFPHVAEVAESFWSGIDH